MTIQLKPSRKAILPVNYGVAKRIAPNIRWYLVVLLLSLPLIILIWQVSKDYIFVRFSGIVVFDTVALRAPMAGYIDSISVHKGDFVSEGQSLMQFKSPDMEVQLSNLEQEEHLLNEMIKKITPDNVQKQKEALEFAQKDIDDSKKHLDRLEHYVQTGNIVVLQVEEARKNYVAAQEHLDNLVREFAEKQQATNTNLEVNYYRKVREIKNQIAQLLEAKKYFKLRAQKSGTVMQLDTYVKEFVSAGQPLMTLLTQENLHIETYIDPKYLGDVYKGQIVTIEFPNREKIEGYIEDTPRYSEKKPEDKNNPMMAGENKLVAIIRTKKNIPEKYKVYGIPLKISLNRSLF